jgi:hypothetical protein
MTDELERIWKESWPNGGLSWHLLGGLRKATKNLRQDSWCPRYRYGALPNWSKWNEVYDNHAEKH